MPGEDSDEERDFDAEAAAAEEEESSEDEDDDGEGDEEGGLTSSQAQVSAVAMLGRPPHCFGPLTWNLGSGLSEWSLVMDKLDVAQQDLCLPPCQPLPPDPPAQTLVIGCCF